MKCTPTRTDKEKHEPDSSCRVSKMKIVLPLAVTTRSRSKQQNKDAGLMQVHAEMKPTTTTRRVGPSCTIKKTGKRRSRKVARNQGNQQNKCGAAESKRELTAEQTNVMECTLYSDIWLNMSSEASKKSMTEGLVALSTWNNVVPKENRTNIKKLELNSDLLIKSNINDLRKTTNPVSSEEVAKGNNLNQDVVELVMPRKYVAKCRNSNLIEDHSNPEGYNPEETNTYSQPSKVKENTRSPPSTASQHLEKPTHPVADLCRYEEETIVISDEDEQDPTSIHHHLNSLIFDEEFEPCYNHEPAEKRWIENMNDENIFSNHRQEELLCIDECEATPLNPSDSDDEMGW